MLAHVMSNQRLCLIHVVGLSIAQCYVLKNNDKCRRRSSCNLVTSCILVTSCPSPNKMLRPRHITQSISHITPLHWGNVASLLVFSICPLSCESIVRFSINHIKTKAIGHCTKIITKIFGNVIPVVHLEDGYVSPT